MKVLRIAVVGFLGIAIGGFGGVAASQSMFGSEGSFSTFLSRLEWKPDCRKPDIPQSWSSDWDRQHFPDEARRWAACVNQQAENDARYAADIVITGQEEAIAEFTREIRSSG